MRLLITLITLLGGVCPVLAQNCWNNTPQTTTTDWRHYPTNSLNNWDWTDTGQQTFYMNQYNYVHVGGVLQQSFVGTAALQYYLPYYCPLPIGSTGCGNSNTSPLHNILPDSMDIKPEDGWELVVKNFGFCCSPATAVTNPVYALYNRHTGRLKVFMLIGSPYDKQGMIIEIRFNDGTYKRSLFAHAEPFAKTLKEMDSSLHYKVPNHYEMMPNYWVWADVQLSYDVCNCANNQISEIQIRPRLIDQANIELVGDGSIIDASVMNSTVPGGGNFNQNAESKRSFVEVANAGFKAGQEAQKEWKGVSDNVSNVVGFIGTEYKKYMVDQFWKQKVKTDPRYTGLTQTQKDTLFNRYMRSKDDVKELVGVKNLRATDNVVKLIKNVASYYPYIGAVIGFIDYFSQGGGESPQTVSTTAPMHFNVNLRFQGSLTRSTILPSPIFYTPGSPVQPSMSKRPFYNNTMGVVALFNRPKLEYMNYISTVHEFVQGDCPIFPYPGINNFYDYRFKQYRLKEPVKYVLNPASKLEMVSIDAAYVLEYTRKSIDPFLLERGDFVNNLNRVTQFYYNAQVPALMDNPNEWLDSTPVTRLHEHTDMVIDYVADNFSSASINDSNAIFRVRTKYVPLNCLDKISFLLHAGRSAHPEYAPKVFLKLYIKMQRTDNPNAEPVTQVITYAMGTVNDATNAGPPMLDASPRYESSCTDIQSGGVIPIYLKKLINPVFLTQYYIDRTVVVQTGGQVSQNLFARDSIIIEDGVTIDSGVILHAGKAVIVRPNNQFNDVILRTGELNLFDCDKEDIATLHANDDEIASICQSPEYINKIKNFKTDPYTDVDVREEDKPIGALYPNPASAISYLYYGLEEFAEHDVVITLHDVYGREILTRLREKQNNGTYRVEFDVSNLADGVYFVNLAINGKRESHRLVVLK